MNIAALEDAYAARMRVQAVRDRIEAMRRFPDEDDQPSHGAGRRDVSSARILRLLGERGPMTRRELIDAMDMDRSQMARALARLSRQGVVTELDGPIPRRLALVGDGEASDE